MRWISLVLRNEKQISKVNTCFPSETEVVIMRILTTCVLRKILKALAGIFQHLTSSSGLG